jgi:Mycothiol maleylpyruvate isomerase N-terminal domain
MTSSWVVELEKRATDVVAVWLVADQSGRAFHREILRRSGPGTAAGILVQQEAVADALATALAATTEEQLREPGGEEDWNVAQAFAHTTAGRRFLATWAALDVDRPWPSHRPPTVTPSVPGRADATREELLVLLDKSRRALREAASRIEDHETQPCGMEHPLVGVRRR